MPSLLGRAPVSRATACLRFQGLEYSQSGVIRDYGDYGYSLRGICAAEGRGNVHPQSREEKWLVLTSESFLASTQFFVHVAANGGGFGFNGGFLSTLRIHLQCA